MNFRRVCVILALGSSVLSTILAALAIGIGPVGGFESTPPSWVTNIHYLVFITNGITAGLLWQYRFHQSTVISLFTTGLLNVLCLNLKRILSWTPDFTPALFVGYASFLGVIMGGIAIPFVDVDEIRSALRSHDLLFVLAGATAVVLEIAFGPFSTAILLIPLLWAHGVGVFLLPVVVLGSVRWGRARDTLQQGLVLLAAGGLCLLLVAPTWRHGFQGTGAYCSGNAWSSLSYSVDWATMRFEWSDGCNSYSFVVERTPAIAGIVLSVAGVAGTLVTSRFRTDGR